MPSGFVTRFAPSPTGYLHLGHAFSALSAARAAAESGGRCLLRIEDIDTARCKLRFETAIEDELEWLGLSWEHPVRRQSEHMAYYREVLAGLKARGLVYACDRTRRDVLEGLARAPQSGDAIDVPQTRPGRDVAWRLSLAAAERQLGDLSNLSFVEEGAGPAGERGEIRVDPAKVGDVVLGRKGLGVSYHLAVVIDDAGQDVSHVVRGADLFDASHTQRVLQALLDLPSPIYRHHRLILRPDGRRFAKRDTTETLRDMRNGGASPQDIRHSLGFAA